VRPDEESISRESEIFDMKKMRPWAMAPGLVGVLLLAVAGIGQGQLGIGGPGEGIKLALLRLPAVQKELALTAKQKAEIARLGEEAKAAKKEVDSASKGQEKSKAEEIPKGLPDPAKEARDSALADLESRTDTSLRKLLDSKQRTRLSEIALQAEGPQAFLKPELIEALGIDDLQLEQIQGILNSVREQQEQTKAIQKRSAELGTIALEKVSKEQQKVQSRGIALKIGKKAMSEIGRVLTKSQRAKYTKLLGEPFDLAGVTDAEGRKLVDDTADMASMLLKMPAVREELKLAVEQVAALDREEPAAKVLKPVQRSRLAQIALQSEGASAFTRPEVIRSLKLNDEQIDQIGNILDGLGEARRQLRDARKQADEARKAAGEPEPDPDVEKTRKDQEKEKMATVADNLGKGVMSRIAGVLTKAQREAFRKQLGEPFDFSKLRGLGGQIIAKDAKPAGK
jgi:hypothetical protein